MGFGFCDKEWVDPPDVAGFEGTCEDCEIYVECPCGCGWGYCGEDPARELFPGVDGACEMGRWR